MILRLAKFAYAINCLNEWIGRSFAWLTLGIVLLTFTIVILRKAFDFGSIALQECVVYMHAGVFLLGAAYTLKQDAHVRVDIFYRDMQPQQRAWVDLIGVLCLLAPLCFFILIMSWDYVWQSWQYLEGSREAGGLAVVYLLKTLIPIFAVLVLLQGISKAIQSLATLQGHTQIANCLDQHQPPHQSL